MLDENLSKKRAEVITKVGNLIFLIFLIFIAAFFIRAYVKGYFDSPESFQEYIKSFGAYGPIALTVYNAVQVLLPILPSTIGSVAGAVMFGPIGGFLSNYIGISIGSLLAYQVANIFGAEVVKAIVSEEKYNKYIEWISTKKNYTTFLAICFLLPLAPDDFLCYFSGLSKIDFKKFVIITILTKPWCLLVYSYFFAYLLT